MNQIHSLYETSTSIHKINQASFGRHPFSHVVGGVVDKFKSCSFAFQLTWKKKYILIWSCAQCNVSYNNSKRWQSLAEVWEMLKSRKQAVYCLPRRFTSHIVPLLKGVNFFHKSVVRDKYRLLSDSGLVSKRKRRNYRHHRLIITCREKRNYFLCTHLKFRFE